MTTDRQHCHRSLPSGWSREMELRRGRGWGWGRRSSSVVVVGRSLGRRWHTFDMWQINYGNWMNAAAPLQTCSYPIPPYHLPLPPSLCMGQHRAISPQPWDHFSFSFHFVFLFSCCLLLVCFLLSGSACDICALSSNGSQVYACTPHHTAHTPTHLHTQE